MEQEEMDELMRLARDAVHREDWNAFVGSEEAWRKFAAYVMHIAADRANRVLKAHEEGVL